MGRLYKLRTCHSNLGEEGGERWRLVSEFYGTVKKKIIIIIIIK